MIFDKTTGEKIKFHKKKERKRKKEEKRNQYIINK